VLAYEFVRDKGILVIMPEGPLRAEDFQALSQEVDDYIVSDGALTGVMISAEKFPGWEDFSGFLSHVRFIQENNRDIDKVAAVTDSAFLSIMPRVANLFISATVRHFPIAERDEAMEWLQSGLAES